MGFTPREGSTPSSGTKSLRALVTYVAVKARPDAGRIAQTTAAQGRRKEIYYFRDHQGLEVDLVVPTSDRALTFIEARASRTVTPAMADPLVRIRHAVSRYDVTSLVVHRGTSGDAALAAVRPGVKAVPVDRFLSALATPMRRRARRAR